MKKPLLLSTMLVAASSCGADDEPVGAGCSILEQNAWVKDTLVEWYLEPDQLPDLVPTPAIDPEDFLRNLTSGVDLAPADDVVGRDRFSTIITAQQERNLLDNAFTGFGILMTVDGPRDRGVFRVLDVVGSFEGEPESPASRAGLRRGDAVVSIDARPVYEVSDLERLRGTVLNFGLPAGSRHTLGVRRAGTNALQTVTLTATALAPKSVPLFKIFERDDQRIGYLLLRAYDLSAFEELRRAFAVFADEGVTELIIDQRYNLGGLGLVVDFLGNLLKGNDLESEKTVLRAEVWNPSKAASLNKTIAFDRPACPALLRETEGLEQYECRGDVHGLSGLMKIIFINSGNTASAAEVLLMSMRPHMDVTVVGARSNGKPVGSVPFPGFVDTSESFCGLVLRPTTVRFRNADGDGDFFDGIPARLPRERRPVIRSGGRNRACDRDCPRPPQRQSVPHRSHQRTHHRSPAPPNSGRRRPHPQSLEQPRPMACKSLE